MIISFSGRMASGKDTNAVELKKELEKKGYSCKIVSFGELLREELTNIINDIENTDEYLSKKYNVDVSIIKELKNKVGTNCNLYERTEKSRELLQWWGTEVRRKQNRHYWSDLAKDKFLKLLKEYDYLLVTDARFLNELEMLESLLAYRVCLLVDEREQLKRIKERDNLVPTREQLNHKSEKEFMVYFDDFNYIVDTEQIEPKEVSKIIIDEITKKH